MLYFHKFLFCCYYYSSFIENYSLFHLYQYESEIYSWYNILRLNWCKSSHWEQVPDVPREVHRCIYLTFSKVLIQYTSLFLLFIFCFKLFWLIIITHNCPKTAETLSDVSKALIWLRRLTVRPVYWMSRLRCPL